MKKSEQIFWLRFTISIHATILCFVGGLIIKDWFVTTLGCTLIGSFYLIYFLSDKKVSKSGEPTVSFKTYWDKFITWMHT
jgi:hypothetical protein